MYNYREGKKRIKEILDNKLLVEETAIPKENQFTYENAYYGWVTALFVDIRNSTQLFTNESKEKVSKVIRSFSSEVIEILRDSDNLREIGIRGDCVYAIYSTPWKIDISRIFDRAVEINTFLRMLKLLLEESNLPTITAGIGMSSAEELVIKAGRRYSGINNAVWIGKAVTFASLLSSEANKSGKLSIALSKIAYDNMLEDQISRGLQRVWFQKAYNTTIGEFYHGNIINNSFDEWIAGGMP